MRLECDSVQSQRSGLRSASGALQSQLHYLRLGCDWEERATAAASRSPVAATFDATGRRLVPVAFQSQLHFLRLGCDWFQSQLNFLRLGCDWEERITAAASRSPVAALYLMRLGGDLLQSRSSRNSTICDWVATGRIEQQQQPVAFQSQLHSLRLGCDWFQSQLHFLGYECFRRMVTRTYDVGMILECICCCTRR